VAVGYRVKRPGVECFDLVRYVPNSFVREFPVDSRD
jgi:hypothetical protein